MVPLNKSRVTLCALQFFFIFVYSLSILAPLMTTLAVMSLIHFFGSLKRKEEERVKNY